MRTLGHREIKHFVQGHTVAASLNLNGDQMVYIKHMQVLYSQYTSIKLKGKRKENLEPRVFGCSIHALVSIPVA